MKRHEGEKGGEGKEVLEGGGGDQRGESRKVQGEERRVLTLSFIVSC